MVFVVRRPNGSVDLFHRAAGSVELTLLGNTTDPEAAVTQLRQDHPSIQIDAKGCLPTT